MGTKARKLGGYEAKAVGEFLSGLNGLDVGQGSPVEVVSLRIKVTSLTDGAPSFPVRYDEDEGFVLDVS